MEYIKCMTLFVGVILLLFLSNQAYADDYPKHIMDGVRVNGTQLEIITGQYAVQDKIVNVKASKSFDIRPAEIAHVENEAIKLSKDKPSGYWQGTMLSQPRVRDINAPGSFIEESLIIKKTVDGPSLAKEKDYLVSAPHALVGLGPDATVTDQDTVYASYDYMLQRIDTIAVDAKGIPQLLEGQPAIASPLPPDVPDSSVQIMNIYRPYGAKNLTSEDMYPLLEKASDAFTYTTANRIPKTMKKLKNGEKIKVVCWGDSITAGGDASPGHTYVERFSEELKKKFPKSEIEVVNISIGGTSAAQWMRKGKFAEVSPQPGKPCDFQRVLDEKPDLVTIEFINDMLIPLPAVEEAYNEIVDKLQASETEIILITGSFCYPPLMKFPIMRMSENRPLIYFLYAFGEGHGLAIADASSRWGHLWREGIPYVTLLKNQYNHPDDRGHQLFVDELMKCFAD